MLCFYDSFLFSKNYSMKTLGILFRIYSLIKSCIMRGTACALLPFIIQILNKRPCIKINTIDF